MPMYKDTDITAQFMQETFPAVVAELQTEPEVTAESLRVSHPEIVAGFVAEGETSVDASAAVEAERARVMAISALSKPGAEAIIDAALGDTSVSVNDVKVSLYDHDENTRADSHASHKKDGEKLADDLKGLANGNDGEAETKTPAQKAHALAMKKTKKGEK